MNSFEAGDNGLLRLAFLGVGASAGSDDAADVVRHLQGRMSEGLIPDGDGLLQEMLTAWGIPPGEPGKISGMVCSYPAMRVTFPRGWEIRPRGEGHHGLFDDRGRQRLRWFIHQHERPSLDVCNRFRVTDAQVSATEDVVHVLDGELVIHAIPVRYPHARTWDAEHRYFKEPGGNAEKDGPGMVNYRILRDARNQGNAWLKEHRPGADDDSVSWTLP